jgi:hypothetical protein
VQPRTSFVAVHESGTGSAPRREISFVPMRRRISNDISSNSSLFDTMTYLPTVTRGSICFAMPFCEEDGLPGQARQ